MGHLFKLGIALVTAGYLFAAGCVSIDNPLAAPIPKKATDLFFTVPAHEFKEIKNNTVDRAWQDTKNGNTIAYLSECNAKTESSLKGMEAENLAALTNVEITDSKEYIFNEREALMTTVNGQVDGVDIKLRLVIFKKNGCNFTLSFVGRKKFFGQGEKIFKSFVEDFKAP